ncbi:MAG: PorT family protein [Tannerellaceae bacterium]|jgi:hypothetical protein|nr:PorT family protein [Tannerellaceae bacterium]
MIRRCFFVIIVGLAGVVNADGQQTFQPEFSVGASFGMGVSSVTFVPKVQENYLLGTHAGITVRWLTETFAGLVFEVNYSQQGWDEHFDDPSSYYYSRRLNFIAIPLLAHLYYGKKQVRFFFNIGPKTGFFLNENTTGKVDPDSPPIDEITGKPHSSQQWDMPIENKFAWGICGGPGLEVRTPIGSFMLEGRYYYSLGDLFGNRKADYFSKSSSQVISAKLTYLIPLKK